MQPYKIKRHDAEDVLAQAMCLFASFSNTNDQNML